MISQEEKTLKLKLCITIAKLERKESLHAALQVVRKLNEYGINDDIRTIRDSSYFPAKTKILADCKLSEIEMELTTPESILSQLWAIEGIKKAELKVEVC